MTASPSRDWPWCHQRVERGAQQCWVEGVLRPQEDPGGQSPFPRLLGDGLETVIGGTSQRGRSNRALGQSSLTTGSCPCPLPPVPTVFPASPLLSPCLSLLSLFSAVGLGGALQAPLSVFPPAPFCCRHHHRSRGIRQDELLSPALVPREEALGHPNPGWGKACVSGAKQFSHL